jgi:hypothetical protein
MVQKYSKKIQGEKDHWVDQGYNAEKMELKKIS